MLSTFESATILASSTWRYTRSQQRTHRRRIEAQECNVGAAAQNGCARSPIFSTAGKAVANVQLGLPFVEARTSGIEYGYDLSRVPDLFGVNSRPAAACLRRPDRRSRGDRVPR